MTTKAENHGPISKMTGLLGIDNKNYRYWRLRIMYSAIIGYATFYLVRLNYGIAMPLIGEELGYTKTQLGTIASVFSVFYGIGKFFNGYFSDRSNARYFMVLGLLASAIANFFVGLSSGIIVLGLFWAMNGWFQSMGWPPAARMLTHWFTPKELGTKWAIWSSSHQIGGFAIYFIGSALVTTYGWRYAFFVPASFAGIMSLFLLNRLRDNPKEVGFPPVEHYKGHLRIDDPKEGTKITKREVIDLVFKNKLVWYISLANLFLYIPRMGVLTWAPTFLQEFKGVSLMVAGSQTGFFEIAGLLGGILSGYISDKVFKGRRGPVGCVYLLLLAVAIFVFWKMPPGHAFIDGITLFLAGFLVAGPQVLVGIFIADFASKRAVGVATGFAGVMGYVIGAGFSGIGIGRVVDIWGWESGFMLMIASALIGSAFFALTWNQRAKVLDANYENDK